MSFDSWVRQGFKSWIKMPPPPLVGFCESNWQLPLFRPCTNIVAPTNYGVLDYQSSALQLPSAVPRPIQGDDQCLTGLGCISDLPLVRKVDSALLHIEPTSPANRGDSGLSPRGSQPSTLDPTQSCRHLVRANPISSVAPSKSPAIRSRRLFYDQTRPTFIQQPGGERDHGTKPLRIGSSQSTSSPGFQSHQTTRDRQSGAL